MASITKFSLDTNRLTVVFIASIILIGLIQFFDFPRQEDPPIVIREVVVTAFFPGMEAADMENLVTKEIEQELKDLDNVKKIVSTSAEGISVVTIEFYPEEDIDEAIQKCATGSIWPSRICLRTPKNRWCRRSASLIFRS